VNLGGGGGFQPSILKLPGHCRSKWGPVGRMGPVPLGTGRPSTRRDLSTRNSLHRTKPQAMWLRGPR
jgi:hypothetical protein